MCIGRGVAIASTKRINGNVPMTIGVVAIVVVSSIASICYRRSHLLLLLLLITRVIGRQCCRGERMICSYDHILLVVVLQTIRIDIYQSNNVISIVV